MSRFSPQKLNNSAIIRSFQCRKVVRDVALASEFAAPTSIRELAGHMLRTAPVGVDGKLFVSDLKFSAVTPLVFQALAKGADERFDGIVQGHSVWPIIGARPPNFRYVVGGPGNAIIAECAGAGDFIGCA